MWAGHHVGSQKKYGLKPKAEQDKKMLSRALVNKLCKWVAGGGVLYIRQEKARRAGKVR